MKKGSIQLCVLAIVSREPMYGYRIIKTLKEESGGYFDLKEGTLYPILYRLQEAKMLRSEWLQKDDRPPRNYYTITPAGLESLERAVAEWDKMAKGTRDILNSRKRTGKGS